MAYREVTRVEINEVIRRWQLGLSQRQIAQGTGISRPTVRRYLEAAAELGLRPDGPEPDETQLARLAALSLAGPRRRDAPSEEQLTPWAEQIQVWLTAERLQMTRIHELLAERGCAVSYNSLRRFIQRRGCRRPVSRSGTSPSRPKSSSAADAEDADDILLTMPAYEGDIAGLYRAAFAEFEGDDGTVEIVDVCSRLRVGFTTGWLS